jgi:hypothetical protein
MSERNDLLNSVAQTISSYSKRKFELLGPMHVERWLNQFTPENQLDFIREYDHVIKKLYITREKVAGFLRDLAHSNKLAGENPAQFWMNACVLTIQKDGNSQREMNAIFAEILLNDFNIEMKTSPENCETFIYLDDVLFSGNRAYSDLKTWVATTAPQNAKLHVIFMALHTSGFLYYFDRSKGLLTQFIVRSAKKIQFMVWRESVVQNTKNDTASSDVLWPVGFPVNDAVQAYQALNYDYPLQPRVDVNSTSGLFLSEGGRRVLEHEFLIAGSKIIMSVQNRRSFWRPLGKHNFGVGFGTLIASYRNCPNNAPLAIWWGETSYHGFGNKWYPLLPRTGYNRA